MIFNCKFYLRPKLLCFLHVTEECKVKIVSSWFDGICRCSWVIINRSTFSYLTKSMLSNIFSNDAFKMFWVYFWLGGERLNMYLLVHQVYQAWHVLFSLSNWIIPDCLMTFNCGSQVTRILPAICFWYRERNGSSLIASHNERTSKSGTKDRQDHCFDIDYFLDWITICLTLDFGCFDCNLKRTTSFLFCVMLLNKPLCKHFEIISALNFKQIHFLIVYLISQLFFPS
jgi:hypothetical protein